VLLVPERRASVSVRVDFFADLPVARRLMPSVTFTDPFAFFSARLTAADGFSVTDVLPAAQLAGSYRVSISARDLAGNAAARSGRARVTVRS
jgi:hypothetical protein